MERHTINLLCNHAACDSFHEVQISHYIARRIVAGIGWHVATKAAATGFRLSMN